MFYFILILEHVIGLNLEPYTRRTKKKQMKHIRADLWSIK